MIRPFYIFFLLCCLGISLFSQAPTDSLEKLLETTENDSQRVQLLNKISNRMWRMDPPKSIEYSKEALALAEKINDKYGEVVASRLLASAYGFSGQHKESLEYGLRALKGGELLNDTTQVRRSLYALGYTYLALDENEKALRTISRIWDLVKNKNDERKKANALHHLGLVHNAMEDYQQVIRYSQQALDISERIGNQSQVTYSLGLLGLAYRNLKQPKKALDYFLRSVQMSEEKGDKLGLIYGYCDLGITYRELGDIPNSLLFLKKSLKLTQEIHFSDELITIYEELAKSYELVTDYENALESFKKFKGYSDSLYSEKNAQKIAELVAEHELAQEAREKEIELLKKDNEIQELNLNRQMWLRNFLISIALLSIVIAALVYKFYQAKKRAVDIQTSKAVQLKEMNDQLNHEIDEHKQTTEALAAEKERLDVTLSSIGDGVITAGSDGKIVLFNRVAEKLTGWSQQDAVGNTLEEVLSINDQDGYSVKSMIDKAIAHDTIVEENAAAILTARDGTERMVSNCVAPVHAEDNTIIGVVLIVRDITEKQQMEEELRRTHKLESIGTLAGGIAHDFNNILTTILANISYVKITSEPDSEQSSRLEEAERASRVARDLTQKLLTFAKGGAPIKKTVSTRQMVQDSVDLCLSGSNVKCELVFPKSPWDVDVDAGQMIQALNHIIINADQAMPEGGILRIVTENFALPAMGNDSVEKGRFVKISVIDQGIGISKTHLKKIFDPYFSTKQKGRGLGLTTAYAIIKQHNGFINVDSQVGIGTTFHIFLPASTEKADAPIIKPKQKNGALKGTGKVLVMDDDASIRNVLEVMLRHLGYETCLTADGVEAVVAYEEALKSDRPFDAVILDLTVPGGMGGKDTMSELLDIDPDVRAIVASGYSNDPVLANYEHFGFRGYISKPFDMVQMTELLQEILQIKV